MIVLLVLLFARFIKTTVASVELENFTPGNDVQTMQDMFIKEYEQMMKAKGPMPSLISGLESSGEHSSDYFKTLQDMLLKKDDEFLKEAPVPDIRRKGDSVISTETPNSNFNSLQDMFAKEYDEMMKVAQVPGLRRSGGDNEKSMVAPATSAPPEQKMCCAPTGCFPCPMPVPISMPMYPAPQPVPLVIPFRTVYEPVIHDHPSPEKIMEIIKKGKKGSHRKWRKRPRSSSSSEDYSDDTDSSANDDHDIDYYDSFIRVRA